MGEDEYEHDRVADDIKTNAIEISATKRAQDNQGVCMLCIQYVKENCQPGCFRTAE